MKISTSPFGCALFQDIGRIRVGFGLIKYPWREGQSPLIKKLVFIGKIPMLFQNIYQIRFLWFTAAIKVAK